MPRRRSTCRLPFVVSMLVLGLVVMQFFSPTGHHNRNDGSNANMKPAMEQETKVFTDFRVCRHASDRFPLSAIGKKNTSWIAERRYSCTPSNAYQQFGTRLEAYLEQQRHQPQATWGRRPWAIPPGSRVLVVGNSHTRQLVLTWMCQYNHQVSLIESLWSSQASSGTSTPCLTDFPEHGQCGMAMRVFFENPAVGSSTVMDVLVNIPLFYTRDWPNRLKELLNVSSLVETYDAWIIGKINSFAGDGGTSNLFGRIMANLSFHIPGMDYQHIKPPRIGGWVSLLMNETRSQHISYGGDHNHRPSVIAVSMFSRAALGYAQSTKRFILDYNNNESNLSLAFVDGRSYISVLGGECGSISIRGDNLQGMCVEAPKRSHACTGNRGGHVDLILYDILEYLYRFRKDGVD